MSQLPKTFRVIRFRQSWLVCTRQTVVNDVLFRVCRMPSCQFVGNYVVANAWFVAEEEIGDRIRSLWGKLIKRSSEVPRKILHGLNYFWISMKKTMSINRVLSNVPLCPIDVKYFKCPIDYIFLPFTTIHPFWKIDFIYFSLLVPIIFIIFL